MPRTDPGGAGRGPSAGVRGILAVARLERWLWLVLVALVVACAARYVQRHGGSTDALWILGLAGALLLVAAARPVVRRAWWPPVWVGVVVGLWAVLTVWAPSFAWAAVPLAFAALQVLPLLAAVTVVALMTAVVIVGWLRVIDQFDVTLVAGPIGMALLTVLTYRALERQSRARQLLIDELTATREDLAEAQRRAGAVAERARLSREIHDSVGQGLSSVNLLLQAADQSWDHRPDTARDHVRHAAATARDSLDDVRRVVRDLAPETLADDRTGAAVPDALAELVRRGIPGVALSLRVHGTPVPVPADAGAAIVRTARGALANVAEHSAATSAVVSLTYLDDEVLLDVRDDGIGFAAGRTAGEPPGRDRGHGLAGIRARAATVGGRVGVESAPGEGTTISFAVPFGPVHPGAGHSLRSGAPAPTSAGT